MKKIFKNTEIFFQKNNKTMESGKITTRIIKGIYTTLYSIGIIALFIGYNFKDSPPPSGWYLQTMPNLGGRSIKDVFFLDSLTGWAVTPYIQEFDTAYVLKTTNGGDNWNISNVRAGQWVGYNKIKFLNNNTGFTCGSSQSSGYKGLNKSTDGGVTWFSLNVPDVYLNYLDMVVLNEDTIWLVSSESLTGGVFRTTNGGQSWTQQLSAGNHNPDKIYMYNARIGFICDNASGGLLRKTTNGGNNWFSILNEGFTDMYFIDSLIGWKCWGENDSIKTTTNGGLNWTKILLPRGSFYYFSLLRDIEVINKDTIWGVGATGITPSGNRGLIYLTTNGGLNWGYQLPDINQVSFPVYRFIQFNNKYSGWAYRTGGGIHTVTGGDTTFYTAITQISTEVPKEYLLYQNYPNPFNQFTIINYKCSIAGEISLKVFDILGKEVRTLVNEKKQAGTYQLRFDAEGLPSGVYFYSLIIDGKNIDTKKLVLLK